MPGVYAEGAFDIAGTLVGYAERKRLLPRDDVAAGDALIGVASSGPHTNGFSFLRKLFDWVPMDVTPPGFDTSLGEALLNRTARTCTCSDRRSTPGASRRSPTSPVVDSRKPAPRPARRRRRRDRVGFVASRAALRSDRRARHRCRHPRVTPDAEHGDRDGAGRRQRRCRRCASDDRRADLVDRPARRLGGSTAPCRPALADGVVDERRSHQSTGHFNCCRQGEMNTVGLC